MWRKRFARLLLALANLSSSGSMNLNPELLLEGSIPAG